MEHGLTRDDLMLIQALVASAHDKVSNPVVTDIHRKRLLEKLGKKIGGLINAETEVR